MKKLLFFCFIAAVIFSGCVSATTFKTATDESEARRVRIEKVSGELEAAQKENERLSKELVGLKAEKKRLEASGSSSAEEAAALKARVEELTALASSLTKEVEGLKVDKERLAASDAAKAGEIASLKNDLDGRTGEKEYLGREVERLKLKAGELSSAKEQELANVKSTYENLVKELKKEIEQGDVKITRAVDRLSVNMVEKILFDSGKAEIKKDGLEVIKRVGDILKKVTDRQIRVEGHTDNVQIGSRIKGKYPTNWELSTARATNVVRYLQDKVGIDPKMLSAAGLADNKPVASNDTPEGRARNRRIEIALLPIDADRVLEELKK